MTSKAIADNLRKIESAKSQGFYVEALLRSYHMSVGLVKHLVTNSTETEPKKTRVKSLLKQLQKAQKNDGGSSRLINEQNLRTVRTWFEKSEQYFKVLRKQRPLNTRQMLTQGSKISGILIESASQISKGKRSAV